MDSSMDINSHQNVRIDIFGHPVGKVIDATSMVNLLDHGRRIACGRVARPRKQFLIADYVVFIAL